MSFSCPETEKVGYPTRAQARSAIEAIRRKGMRMTDKKPTASYVCEFCGQWHLTSQPR